MATLLPEGKQSFTNSAGAPLVGGKVYTYDAGTSTPRQTFSDAAGTTPNANPVILDARGEATIFWSGVYKVVLKDAADVTIWTVDNVSGVSAQDLSSSAGAGFVGFLYAAVYAAGTLGKWLQDLALSTGAGFIGWIQSGVGAVLRTVSDRLLDQVNVTDFMTSAQVADVRSRAGTLDVTAAIQAAINKATPKGRVIFPAGVYKTTSQLLVSGDRVHLQGAGSYATQILFAPTAAATCLKLSAGAAIMSQGSVTGFTFFSDNSTFTKTAIEMIDVDIYRFQDITISGSIAGAAGSVYWSGASSIGMRTRGRDLTDINGITIFADRPVVISQNPNNTISIDHFHFSNCYFGANGNPIIEVETGVNLTQVTFDGFQAWVVGTTGFKWIDTTSTGVSEGLKFENVRAEQGTDITAYMFDIQHNTGLQSPVFRNCYGGVDRRGFRLRKCENVNIDQHFHAGTTETLNVDATVKRIKLNQCFWQATSTATLVGQRLLFGTPLNPNTAPLPGTAIYDETTNVPRTVTIDAAIAHAPFTVANNGVTALSNNGSNMQGLLLVTDERGLGALFMVYGNQANCTLVSGLGFYTATAGGAGTINVYWSAGNTRYELENKSGASRTIKVALLGSYGTF